MPYTFKPKEEHAKAYGDNLSVSTKNALKVCRAITRKKLTTAKRLLEDLMTEKRSLKGKYYTNACAAILSVLESCEKNAEFMGLEMDKLFVHAGATHGVHRRRRRRKSNYGSAMKLTNVEIILIQRGKEKVSQPKNDLKKEIQNAVEEKAKEIKLVPKESLEDKILKPAVKMEQNVQKARTEQMEKKLVKKGEKNEGK